MPEYKVIDLRQHPHTEGISQPLIEAIRMHLAAGNQVMMFLNRRGYAPVLYCSQCAYIAECKRCDARLVYHKNPISLRCHHCDAKHVIPKECPKCHASSMQPVGLGTQRLEQFLLEQFSDIPVIRLDRDNTKKKGELQALLERIHQTGPAILLGTQMLAKGHHFPNVTLVGIIDADSGLFSVDFRAAEQMGQLLEQVAGRAGRADKLGTVMIQTRHPELPSLKLLLEKGYKTFAETLLEERENAALPPYSYLAVLKAEAYKAEAVEKFLNKLKEFCASTFDSVTLLGPVSALIAKKKGLHCQHLLLKADKRGVLQKILQAVLTELDGLSSSSTVKWTLDVDPVDAL
jgi:primosomal protein N' (replication factor Y)